MAKTIGGYTPKKIALRAKLRQIDYGPFIASRQCPTKTPEPHLLGEFPMSCYNCHEHADS